MSGVTAVDYNTLIPNNVGLADDARLKRALEQWYPNYINWWREQGPRDFQHLDVYLRTAISVDQEGWAKFGFVKMPEYRWGILLAPADTERRIGFGSHQGEPVWQEVPGEYRALLRRLVVVQGDTEPASVEQQRYLGHTAPSLYDMRSLFQVNVEEGRHLWAMVYLLHRYFGRDGREEAEALLQRHSGDDDRPRILGAFNEETPDWLSFFMFTTFTDRDGKMQLESLAQSGFDPLARTTRFMLTEEGHHMFVGRTGVERVVRRTAETLRTHGIRDPEAIGLQRELGVIDLPAIQRKINFHYAVTLDLFGSEVSTNAANAYNASLKGRFREGAIDDDHRLLDSTYPVLCHVDGAFRKVEKPALNALNARLCDVFIEECEQILDGWNKVLRDNDVDFALTLPHRAFHRAVGEFAGLSVSPDGRVMGADEWTARRDQWLPSTGDMDYIRSLMKPVRDAGGYAPWIAPPGAGINGQPVDFEYVKIAS